MSEGTPGRGPDADTRTDGGAGQGAGNGRQAPQPVRYGPRNGSPRGANGSNGSNGSTSNGRTVPAGSSPQQYRAPQPSPERTNGAANGSGANVPTGNGSGSSSSGNGSGSNGSDSNGSGSNGSGSNGRHATPSSYTRPRPDQASAPARPEQDRAVADARTQTAARNASAARGRDTRPTGGIDPAATARTALVPTPPTGPAPNGSDDTAVTPVVRPDEDRSEPVAGDSATSTTSRPATGEKATGIRGFFGLPQRAAQPAGASTAQPADAAAATTAAAASATTTAPSTTGQPSDQVESATDPAATSEAGDDGASTDATEERPLTWRDRLGLPPKAAKPQPIVIPDSGPGVPTAAAAAAVAATVAAGSTPPETKATPVGPTTAPGAPEFRGPVTPASPAPGTSDTIVIPAVDAGAVSPTAPAAAATAQPLVAAKPKVGLARRTRKARLRLSRVDPWSVMKTAFLFSIAAGIILVVATYGVWSVLNASGLFDAVNDMVKSVVSTPGDTTPFRIEEYVNTQKVLGLAAIIAVVDVLIFTALATLGSFLYNLAATVLGGLEVTLAED